MKRVIINASVLVASVLVVASAASATPFKKFMGSYAVRSVECLNNGRPVTCDATPEFAMVWENGANEATVTIEDRVITMSAFSFTNEDSSNVGRFDGSDTAASWTHDTTYGDVAQSMSRVGQSVSIKIVEPTTHTMTIMSYSVSGSRVSTQEARYVMTPVN